MYWLAASSGRCGDFSIQALSVCWATSRRSAFVRARVQAAPRGRRIEAATLSSRLARTVIRIRENPNDPLWDQRGPSQTTTSAAALCRLRRRLFLRRNVAPNRRRSKQNWNDDEVRLREAISRADPPCFEDKPQAEAAATESRQYEREQHVSWDRRERERWKRDSAKEYVTRSPNFAHHAPRCAVIFWPSRRRPGDGHLCGSGRDARSAIYLRAPEGDRVLR